MLSRPNAGLAISINAADVEAVVVMERIAHALVCDGKRPSKSALMFMLVISK